MWIKCLAKLKIFHLWEPLLCQNKFPQNGLAVHWNSYRLVLNLPKLLILPILSYYLFPFNSQSISGRLSADILINHLMIWCLNDLRELAQMQAEIEIFLFNYNQYLKVFLKILQLLKKFDYFLTLKAIEIAEILDSSFYFFYNLILESIFHYNLIVDQVI